MSFLQTYDNTEVVHLQETKSSFLSRIRIRPFNKSDLDIIRYMFELSFPVNYGDEFFQCVSAQFFNGHKLLTYMAEYLNGVISSFFLLIIG